jgi:LPXTG-motif cell wall-anchored protein
MSIRRLLAGLALGTVASVIASAPASADTATPTPTYPPQVGGLTVSATTLVAGGTLTISGGGFAPGCSATITVAVAGLGVVRSLTATANSSGMISAGLTLSTVGTNTVTVSCAAPNGAPRVLSATVVVSAPAASGLPNTGSNILSPLILGGVLVLGGAGVIAAARRRRRRGNAESAG